MKQSFLDSLVGKSMAEANEAVRAAGYKAILCNPGDVFTAVARSDTVFVIGNKNDLNSPVQRATAGDPVQASDWHYEP